MAAPTTDPLKPLEQMARRWALLAPAVPTALFVTFVIIMTILQPPATAQLASYALNIGSILVALFAFGLLIRYLAARGIRRLAPLTPRVKEAGLAMRGLSLLLDNGLLVSFFQSGAFPTMFFDADGSALHPRLAEALRWTRPRRLKFVRMVRSRTGPPWRWRNPLRVAPSPRSMKQGPPRARSEVLVGSFPLPCFSFSGDPRWTASRRTSRTSNPSSMDSFGRP